MKQDEKDAFFNKVVLAWSDNPNKGTAGIYIDGVLTVTYTERGARRPSTDHVRAQALQHVKYKEDGNELVEMNITFPLPETLEDQEIPTDGKAVPAGLANDNYDQQAKRTDSNAA